MDWKCLLRWAGRFGWMAVLSVGVVAQGATIRLAVNPWTGSAVNAEAAKILLSEKLGYAVELVPIDEFEQFPAMASGELSATLEIWPSGHQEDRSLYIEQQKTVSDLGPLGVIGKIGWYVPSYLVQADPSLATWQGIKAHAEIFKTAASGEQGQFLQGDPTWLYKDQTIIDALGLNLKIVQAGSEAALLQAIETAYTARAPLLFYFWTPHAVHSKYELTEVQLPAYVDGCTGCDYPSETLYKAASSTLATTAPGAERLLRHFQLTREAQLQMIGAVENQGKTPAQAAREWVNANASVWQPWLGPRLAIERVGTTLHISYPADAEGFRLQRSASLGAGASWQNVTAMPHVADGRVMVEVPLEGGESYYRVVAE